MLSYYYSWYFSLYKVFNKIKIDDDINDWNSIIILSFFESLNILVLYGLIGLNSFIYASFTFFVVCILNFYILVKNKHVIKIKDKLEKKVSNYGALPLITLLLYFVVSFLSFLFFFVGI